MAFYREATDQPFTIIANEVLQDESLTLEATGLLAFMLSLPPHWRYHQEWLQKQKPKLGRDKLARIIKELEKAGYIVRKHKQDAKGKMAGHDWVIYPAKQLQPSKINTSTESLKNRDSDFPRLGKSAAINKQSYKEKKVSQSTTRARDFSLDEIVVALYEMGMPKTEAWYATRKAQEYMARFPDSRSVADACRYVVNAIDHARALEGKSR